MQNLSEVRNEYIDDDNYCHIDGYFTEDDNEEGITVAIVDMDNGKVYFIDNRLRNDNLVKEAIAEVKANIGKRQPTEIADQIAKEIEWEIDVAEKVILALLTEVNAHKEKIAVERALSQFDESEGQEIEFSVQLKLDRYSEKNKDLVWEMATKVMEALVRQMNNGGFTPDDTDAYVEKILITSGNHFSDVTDFSSQK